MAIFLDSLAIFFVVGSRVTSARPIVQRFSGPYRFAAPRLADRLFLELRTSDRLRTNFTHQEKVTN